MAVTRAKHRDEESGKFAEGPVPKRQVLEDEHSGEQQTGHKWLNQLLLGNAYGAFGMGTGLFAAGGSPLNPMGFPGYGSLYGGTPVTYRWMLQHPILRLVRSIVVSAIAAGGPWEYDKVDPKADDKDRELLARTFDPLREVLITEFYARARDYGWHSGELIWENKDDALIITRVKPLLQDITEIWRDGHGNFLGLKNHAGIRSTIAQTDGQLSIKETVGNQGMVSKIVPAPFKAWTFAYDSESDYAYGRSWLENVRETAWVDWLDTMQQMQKLGSKISDKVTVVKSPAGTFPGPPGPDGKPKLISYRENAETAIKALAAGAAGVWFPSLGLNVDAKGSIDAMKVLVELVNKSVFDVEVLDFGNHAAAIAGFIMRAEHAEMLMFSGGLRSSRTGMEGQHRGGKADAESHTDTGTLNAEQDDRCFARGCQPLIDAVMVANRGDKAKGAWRIKPPSLVDRKMDVMKAILLAVINDPIIAEEMVQTLSVDKLLDGMGIDRVKPFSGADLKKRIDAVNNKQNQAGGGKANKAKTKKNPNPQGGRPK